MRIGNAHGRVFVRLAQGATISPKNQSFWLGGGFWLHGVSPAAESKEIRIVVLNDPNLRSPSLKCVGGRSANVATADHKLRKFWETRDRRQAFVRYARRTYIKVFQLGQCREPPNPVVGYLRRNDAQMLQLVELTNCRQPVVVELRAIHVD